jgi:hypothetical protein
MNDLLWLVNHPLRGNVVGILTGQNPDTPEGLESWLSVRIHRIPAELPHSTELEHGNLLRNRTDSSRASALELLWGLLTNQELLQPLEPRLSLYSLHTLCWGSTMVFIGGLGQCCGRRLGAWGPLVWPTDHATWPGGQVSSLHHLWPWDTLSTASNGHVDKMVSGNAPTHGRLAKVMWPAGHTLARLSPCFLPCHFLVSYCLWPCLILDIMKICTEFLSSDVPEMVDQQNSWNTLVIRTYLRYLKWNVGMLVVNICILWSPTNL